MDLPDCINYTAPAGPEPNKTVPDIINYLKEEDLETTRIEDIIKMSNNYLEYDNPILYRLYLHLNPNLKKEKVEMIEHKIQELLELHIKKQNEINEVLNNK